MKSALSLMALLIVGFGDVSVQRSAIAQSLTLQTTATTNLETANSDTTNSDTTNSDNSKTGAADLDGTQGREITSDALFLEADEATSDEEPAISTGPFSALPLTLDDLRTNASISTAETAIAANSNGSQLEATAENRASNPTNAQIDGLPTANSSPQQKPSAGASTGERSPTALDEVTQTLKLELHLSERQLLVYKGEMLVADYPVAVGREGWQTPTGEFSVFQKQTDPTWEHPFTGELVPPGPENPLGSRWIGFWSDGQNSIGFHGTPDESVIGSAVSHGCVRMRDEDIQTLYELVSLETSVIVLP